MTRDRVRTSDARDAWKTILCWKVQAAITRRSPHFFLGSGTMTTTTTPKDVFLFVPNLIGYARIIATIVSLNLVGSWWSLVVYLASFVLDLVDGWVARQLGQTSELGGLLDMLTDRCSTMGLLYVLGKLYDHQIFLALAVLDVASHWCQMYSSAGQHHKSATNNQNRHFLVRWFYGYYWFFGYLCVGTELTYLFLYAWTLTESEDELRGILQIGLVVGIPACIAKQCVNCMQLVSSLQVIAARDAEQHNKTS